MKIHILGICGTFMAGIASIAKQLGHEVTGSDAHTYPPTSDQLQALGIELFDGYRAANVPAKVDLVIIGNAITRGNLELEAVLNKNVPYTSGPQWLAEHVLQRKHVLAVSGTHGKTTVTSMLAWILSSAGKKPGFLVGGVPGNFSQSAHLGEGDCFVIEADEYDSAYFDKRSKFIHYRPNTLILNNLEFDHADIFESLADIKKQFHHLIRTVPDNGALIVNAVDENLTDVLKQGYWTPVIRFNADSEWKTELRDTAGGQFAVYFNGKLMGEVEWDLFGAHNVSNALAAIVAASQVGVDVNAAAKSLKTFKNTKRRLEKKGVYQGVTVYDDFAHHPTAIIETVNALKNRLNESKLIVVLEFGSYTMRSGAHAIKDLSKALQNASEIYLKQPRDKKWDVNQLTAHLSQPVKVFDKTQLLVDDLVRSAELNDTILVMSNTGFDDFFQKLEEGFSYVA